ncbi:RCC1 domain-containing protein [Pandoraea anhela]|uniref:Uncharacterized protein n=1 Tax=Pandoraea anhela TaxID=2508295 RepID=A0A5E4TAT2_9BURK|nr:hypothetical protein [Pandoraea anhela]VVD83584.1 hypothetical protein PAN31108_01239 [Pandoraea anhela]
MAELDAFPGGFSMGALTAPRSGDTVVDGALDPDKLGARGASFIVPAYVGMKDGDHILLRFDSGGPHEATADADVSTNTMGKPTTLRISKALVAAALGTTVTVDYTVEPEDESGPVDSAPLRLFIGVKAVPVDKLAAPSVDEAMGDYLAPESAALGVHVRVPRYDSMAPGDVVSLSVGRPGEANHHTDTIEVHTAEALTFAVPPEALTPFVNLWMPVSYSVVRGAQKFSSDVFQVQVGDVSGEGLLETPAVAQAVQGVLNVDLTSGGATALIGPYTGIRSGDQVRVVWAGGPPSGFAALAQAPAGDLSVPFDVSIPAAQITPYLDKTVTLYYEKQMPDGTWLRSKLLKLLVKRGPVTCESPSVPASSGGRLDVRDVDPVAGVEVIMPPYQGMQEGDVIRMTWDNEDNTGDYTSEPYGLKPTDVGQPVSFHVPFALVMRDTEQAVTIAYEVVREGTTIVQSKSQTLLVRQVRSPSAMIDEAVGDTINPEDCAGGAHVHIPISAKLRGGDKVVVTLQGQGGGGEYNSTATVSPEQVGSEFEIVVPEAALVANVDRTVALRYTIERQNGAPPEDGPAAVYDVVSAPLSGLLRVMGARANSGQYRASSVPEHLSAWHRDTQASVQAEWRYEDESTWRKGASFRDTRPWVPLKVRALDDSVTLSPVNIASDGLGRIVPGYASIIATCRDGGVVGWGQPQYGGDLPPRIRSYDDVVEVGATSYALALRRANGRIDMWGLEAGGGKLPSGLSVIDAVRLTGSASSFAVLRADGSVRAWGNPTAGGSLPAAIASLTDLRALASTEGAFAGLRADGSMVAWGAQANGGGFPVAYNVYKDFVEVRGNSSAFVALRANKSLVTWGNGADGGTLPAILAVRTDIAFLSGASARAFSAITTGKQVVAWGSITHGATVPTAIASLKNIEEVVTTWGAMCARCSTGQVVAWGNTGEGGTVPADVAALRDIVHVCGTSGAFAALRRDGTVVVWGNQQVGGDISAVKSQLVDICALYANTEAFVAIKAGGGVVTWGVPVSGGDSASVRDRLDAGLHYKASAEVRGRLWALTPV